MPTPTILARLLQHKLLSSLALSAFWVIAVWGFWERGEFAMGPNLTAYLALLVAAFLWQMRAHRGSLRSRLGWIVPIGMIAASFSVYDNPYLKTFGILLLPLLFAVFYNDAMAEGGSRPRWDTRFFPQMFVRCVGFLEQLGASARQHLGLLSVPGTRGAMARRVAIGVVILLLLSVAVIIPVLSSADPAFADAFRGFMDWVAAFLSESAFKRLVVAVILSLVTLAALLAWSRPFGVPDATGSSRQADSVVAGIVLGGVFLLYVLFLFLQAKRLWAGSLPFVFEEVEYAVKSGFWQLLFLSVVNVGFYLYAYKRTSEPVQRILLAFTVASSLLLVSAAQRMALYVTGYGFSYEKFFASYAVLFCAILFGWLLVRLFVRERADVVRFLATLFLWMFAVATLLPVEQFVLRANVALAQRPDTRIRLYELTMLSPDVLGLVERYQREGGLRESRARYDRERAGVGPDTFVLVLENDWTPWIEEQRRRVGDKPWYEKNVMNWMYVAGKEKSDEVTE